MTQTNSHVQREIGTSMCIARVIELDPDRGAVLPTTSGFILQCLLSVRDITECDAPNLNTFMTYEPKMDTFTKGCGEIL